MNSQLLLRACVHRYAVFGHSEGPERAERRMTNVPFRDDQGANVLWLDGQRGTKKSCWQGDISRRETKAGEDQIAHIGA